ncbi:MAG: nucleotidyltransferase domain-containing protein [Candidatus Aenigmarchaeota archaeon]|nr:nucleotidyltransferase domain-containing protein [Candidatus Aenigmarchaeota archaeon]
MKKPDGNKIYQKLYFETGILRILGTLCDFPEKEFSLSDLAKEAEVAKANIGKILDILQKNDFVEITKLTKIWRIKANQKNWNFVKFKIVRNLDAMYHSGIIEFLADRYRNPKSIVLFGSFRRGEDISSSDVDIAVETDEVDEYKVLTLSHIAGLDNTEQFEKKIKRKIQIHLFSRKVVDINVFNNIANGIVLYGFLVVGK